MPLDVVLVAFDSAGSTAGSAGGDECCELEGDGGELSRVFGFKITFAPCSKGLCRLLHLLHVAV